MKVLFQLDTYNNVNVNMDTTLQPQSRAMANVDINTYFYKNISLSELFLYYDVQMTTATFGELICLNIKFH